MPDQLTLFDLPYECQRDCAAEIERLTGQVRAIFDRLLDGPVDNDTLSRMARKYTSRISNLRDWLRPKGFGVECFASDRASGVCWYRLVRIGESP